MDAKLGIVECTLGAEAVLAEAARRLMKPAPLAYSEPEPRLVVTEGGGGAWLRANGSLVPVPTDVFERAVGGGVEIVLAVARPEYMCSPGGPYGNEPRMPRRTIGVAVAGDRRQRAKQREAVAECAQREISDEEAHIARLQSEVDALRARLEEIQTEMRAYVELDNSPRRATDYAVTARGKDTSP